MLIQQERLGVVRVLLVCTIYEKVDVVICYYINHCKIVLPTVDDRAAFENDDLPA